MKPLSDAQKYMLDMLQHEYKAMSDFGMLITFGKNWRRTWSVLEARGLVRYYPYAKQGMHYRSA